ncbi:MAG: BCCT family transporter, partial [Halothiobacillus sp.]|nr:BCCT family transporter [Halothiobacillus sp.]
GLTGLQAMAVSTGLPFTIVLLVGCYSIIQGLRSEPRSA